MHGKDGKDGKDGMEERMKEKQQENKWEINMMATKFQTQKPKTNSNALIMYSSSKSYPDVDSISPPKTTDPHKCHWPRGVGLVKVGGGAVKIGSADRVGTGRRRDIHTILDGLKQLQAQMKGGNERWDHSLGGLLHN